jgi:hypothetical protein
MTPTVFNEHGSKGLDLIKEMPWKNLKKSTGGKLTKRYAHRKG